MLLTNSTDNSLPKEKFSHPFITAKGEERASVELKQLKTLWFNTGTRCNLSCSNCYIESSPHNDRLAFISSAEVISYLEEIKNQSLRTNLIGLTGGEPFLNPEIIDILKAILQRGFRCLVLTNAFRAINRHKAALVELKDQYGPLLMLRVSLDHYLESEHEKQRGKDTFAATLKNISWLQENGFATSIAGRSLGTESSLQSEEGYRQLMQDYGIKLDPSNHDQFVIFPEMKSERDVPEITVACWDILKKTPDEQMCASERMIVKRQGAQSPAVLACTLLAYDPQFELGSTLKDARKSVPLNHRFCAEFCVLGGASCSSTAK